MSDSQSTVVRFPTIGAHLVDRNTPAFAETAPPADGPLTAAELADYNRQRNQRMACCETNGVRSCDQGRQCPARMPAEAATHFGTEMHHAYRPVDGWAVELAFATLALLAVGAFAVIGWLTAP